MNSYEWLIQHKIVAIVRGVSGEAADRTAQALAEGGIRLLEVTMNTEGALDTIARWREQHGERVCIGAGTVLDLAMAKEAVAAGARYLISPNLDEEVIAYGLVQGVDVWPGVMTPTEIVRAWKAGARVVKVFPSGSLGLQYIKEIRAPLSNIPMLVTGGVTLDNIQEYFKAGAVGVGLGNSIVDKSLIEAGRFDELAALARRFVNRVEAL